MEQYTIEKANPDKGSYYVCPQCRRLLDQRRGGVYRPYFAHHKDPWAERNCPWYSGGVIGDELIRKKSIDLAQRIRLFLGIGQIGQTLALFGSIPPFSGVDLPLLEKKLGLGDKVITSQGTSRQVNPKRDLLPDSPSSGIQLDPDSVEFKIEIADGFTNSGFWTADPLLPGNIFIGDQSFAERILDPHYVSTGQYVYLVTEGDDLNLNVSVTKFSLGKYTVLRIGVDTTKTLVLQGWAKNIEIDSVPLHVDVIFPLSENPRKNWLDRTIFDLGDEITLALTPDKLIDPLLEIITIPFNNQDILKLDKIGQGVPRFVKIVPKDAVPFRLLIYWQGAPERNVLLDFVPNGSKKQMLSYKEPEIYLCVERSNKELKLDPIIHSSLNINGELSQEGQAIIPAVRLVCPEHFVVELEAEFGTEQHKFLIRREGYATKTDIQERLVEIFGRYAKKVIINFKSLGTVTLNCEYFYEIQVEQWEGQYKKELAKIKQEQIAELNRQRKTHRTELALLVSKSLENLSVSDHAKVSKKYALEKLGLPKDTPKEDLTTLRNLIRRYRKSKRKSLATETKRSKNGGQN